LLAMRCAENPFESAGSESTLQANTLFAAAGLVRGVHASVTSRVSCLANIECLYFAALYSGIAATQAVLAGRSAAQFQAQMVVRLRPQFRWAGLVNVLFEVRRLHGF